MKQLSKKMHEIFYDVRSPWFLRVNNFLALLTLLSILSIILESVPQLSSYAWLFKTIEYISVAIFTLEYIGRIIAQRNDIKSYVFSFFGVIDLLAIVPTYFGLTNLTFLKSARILRILRFLRLLRLAKITRLKNHRAKDLEDYSYLFKLNIQIYFFSLLSVTILFGSLIYLIEGGPTQMFTSIPDGMLWAAKHVLGGISQQIPETPLGELIALLTRFSGLVLFGLLISIIGKSVTKLLFGTTDLKK